MSAGPAAGDAARHRAAVFVSLDAASLVTFSIVGPILAVVGGGRLGLHSTLDAGTVLAVLACLGPASAATELARRDRTILVGSALTWLALDGRIIAVGLTAAGLMGLSRTSRIPASLATLWMAIAIHVLWAPLLFKVVGRWIIAVEMCVIGDVARATMSNVEVLGARLQSTNGWYVYVLEGCSAFAGLSASTLVWLTTLHLLGTKPDGRALPGLLLGLCGVVGVNVARILLMLPSAEAYAYWHAGPGSTLAVVAGLALGAVPALVTGARR